jgi:hypothetical protein
VTLTVEFSFACSSLELPFRVPNCVFSPDSIDRVRALLLTVSRDPTWHSTHDVDALYARIENCFLSSCRPRKARPQHLKIKRWWQYVSDELCHEITELEADSRHLFAQWSAGTGAFTTSEVVSLRRRYNAAYKTASRTAESAILSRLRGQFTNQSLCWKVLKEIRNPDSTVAIDVGTLVNHFTRVFHCRDRPVLVHPATGESWGSVDEGEEEFIEPFTDAELVSALKSLNIQAATGPELIPSVALRDTFVDDPASRVPLLTLMNSIFQSGKIPDSWGLSELFILYKGKGLRTIPDNYRAIALSNDFGRVYERLLIARLNRWTSKHEATGKMQFGFKKGTSTLEAIFVL